MATVKVGQIRATLDKSVAYILNGAKTERGSLVSTFGCSPMTQDPAAIANDFLAVQDAADAARTVGQRPTVQGLHIIQSFKPGEVDADLAHRVGQEFAERITGGEYQWVLATHTDRGHVHNHLMMNPVNMETLTRYRTPKGRLFEWRNVSDDLCRTHGLSVVETPQRERVAPDLGERYAQAEGRSTKDGLRTKIDKATASATSINDLVRRLAEVGVEVTFSGRSMLVRDVESMSRPVRSWRLGPAYSESNLAARIGQSPVVTFTVKPSMVSVQDNAMARVRIPGMAGSSLVVPNGALVDHGTTWHLHLPDAQTTPVVESDGTYQGAFTTEQIAGWFTPLDPERIIDPKRDIPPMRGRTDAQRRYFAMVDRKAARFADRMEDVNHRAQIARLSPQERAETRDALNAQQRLRAATLQQLLIQKDRVGGHERGALDREINKLARTINTHQKSVALLAEEPSRERNTSRKGPRR